MKCMVCGQQDAVIRLTREMGGQSLTMHFCRRCAEAAGVSATAGVDEAGAWLKPLPSAASESERPSEKGCPDCGLTAREFRRRSRLGCARCYEVFAEDIEPMLKSMHRGLRHVGKRPTMRRRAEIVQLRRMLKALLQRQGVEEDAEWRAQIHERPPER